MAVKNTVHVPLVDLTATQRLACELAELLQPGDTLVLSGELGSGKTALAQHICACWGISDVVSPTFILLQSHQGRYQVHHLDLYRLKHEAELDDLGWAQLAGGDAVVLVEWLDRFPNAYPQDYLEVHLQYAAAASKGRLATVSGGGKRGRGLLEGLKSYVTSSD